jgi:short-subunit dehydrogenase involved in D-alanine esterification of teichoic acids
MQLTENTILITVAVLVSGTRWQAFHNLGNQVIISGRRESLPDETIAAYPA